MVWEWKGGMAGMEWLEWDGGMGTGEDGVVGIRDNGMEWE